MALMTDRAAGNLRRRNALWLAVARDGQGSVTGVMTYTALRRPVMRFYTSSIEARYRSTGSRAHRPRHRG